MPWEYSESMFGWQNSAYERQNEQSTGTQWMRLREHEREEGGYTHSRGVGAALRQPSCQFSTGTGMQVSLMVS